MADPFITHAELPDEPFGFTCGSQAELERLTRCILHIHPQLFTASDKRLEREGLELYNKIIGVRYNAATTLNSGGLQVVPKDSRLRKWFNLAFQYNTFQGGIWAIRDSHGKPRRECVQLIPRYLYFHIAPPSMHEQSEALLVLHDWLEGKVSERERRRLLRLDPPKPRKGRPQ